MEHSDSDINDASSSSDSEEEIYSLHHANNLQPYDFEPAAVVSVDNAALRGNEGGTGLSYESRIGHTNWCICGNCQRWKQTRRADAVGKQTKCPKNSFPVFMIVSQVTTILVPCV